MDITRIMLEKQNGTMKYSWKDKNSMRLNSTRHSAFNYYGDWDWIIATSVWEDDIVSNGIALRNILFPGFFLCAIIILLVLYWSVTRIITARFNELHRIVRAIAEGEGDLTARIEFPGGDEIGILSASFNSFLNDLEKMIADIISASTTLSQAVDVISRGNQNLSQRTVEQSSSLEEIVATLKESGALLSENTESAQKARDMTADGVLQAKEGDRIAGEAVSSINEIKDSSRKIMDVLSLINEITFQTNLLALNAAVEAARAGENGRGFAVVAGEVRSLATRSAAASKEIETIINDSMLKIEQGSSMVTDTGQVLVRISASTRESADLIAEISASSIELSQGMNQIQEAVNILDTMTQQNAALVEETASSTEDMAERARQLLSMLRRFKVNTHSGSMPLLE
jgi:methyl-accepting chemotaxis protein